MFTIVPGGEVVRPYQSPPTQPSICIRAVVLKLRGTPRSLVGLVKPQSFWAPPWCQGFSFSRSGWGLRSCLSDKFPGGVDAAGQGTNTLLGERQSESLSTKKFSKLNQAGARRSF